VLPFRPLPVVTEFRRLGAAIFGGGATVKRKHIISNLYAWICIFKHTQWRRYVQLAGEATAVNAVVIARYQ